MHKILGNGVLIIEKLTNLDSLMGKRILKVNALPTQFPADGTPVLMIASISNRRAPESIKSRH